MSRGQVHNAITRGQLSSALTRAVGDLEGANGLERYGETLTPTIDLFTGPEEWAYLRKERLATGFAAPGAVVGQNGALSLVNPAGSGMIAIATSIVIAPPATLSFEVAFPMADTAAIGAIVATQNSVDARWGAINLPVCKLYGGTTAAPPAGAAVIGQWPALATTTVEVLRVPVILIPGTAIIVACTSANQAIRINCAWRERRAFPGELE